MKTEDMGKKNAIIYGVGHFFFSYEQKINDIYNVKACIDRAKGTGAYDDRRLIRLDEISIYDYDIIIVMIYDIQECINIAKSLINEGVRAENIVLGHSLYGEYSRVIDKIIVLSDGNLLISFGDISIKVKSKDEFANVKEVYIKQVYNYFINNEKRDIVIDIGMNIGDATLYFANRDNVEKVYGYEPFKETFLAAKENLKDYLTENKVEIFQYGISDENKIRAIGFNANMSCGQSTLADIREKAYKRYINWGLVETDDEQIEQIEVRKASEVFLPIIMKYSNHNIILKMDCEGEEYGILEELLQSKILGKFKFIMLEYHYKGKETLLNYLKEATFSWWCSDESEDIGLIYAWSEKA